MMLLLLLALIALFFVTFQNQVNVVRTWAFGTVLLPILLFIMVGTWLVGSLFVVNVSADLLQSIDLAGSSGVIMDANSSMVYSYANFTSKGLRLFAGSALLLGARYMATNPSASAALSSFTNVIGASTVAATGLFANLGLTPLFGFGYEGAVFSFPLNGLLASSGKYKGKTAFYAAVLTNYGWVVFQFQGSVLLNTFVAEMVNFNYRVVIGDAALMSAFLEGQLTKFVTLKSLLASVDNSVVVYKGFPHTLLAMLKPTTQALAFNVMVKKQSVSLAQHRHLTTSK